MKPSDGKCIICSKTTMRRQIVHSGDYLAPESDRMFTFTPIHKKCESTYKVMREKDRIEKLLNH